MSLNIVPEKPQWGGSIKNVCLYTECMFVDMTPVSSRETIGFVWLMLVVLLIARWSWNSFMQGNDWFCLIHISSSAPVYSLLIACTLCWFRQRQRLVLFEWYSDSNSVCASTLEKRHVENAAFSRRLLARCDCGQTWRKNAYTRGNGRYCFEITTFRLFIHFQE